VARNPLSIGLVIVLGAALVGCNTAAKRNLSREEAAQAYTDGTAALESRDFTTAVEKLTLALEGGWLGYITATAYTQRAIANAALGNYDAALADLDVAEQGEGESAETLVARSYVFEKQGKQQEAKTAWNQARRLNRSVKKIED
jgi:Tfp pilus assembly protein PilF